MPSSLSRLLILIFVFLASTGYADAAEESEACPADALATCRETCSSCFLAADKSSYNCSLPGLDILVPGGYEGVVANYLSFETEISSGYFPIRAREFEACTGGKIVFSEATNVFEDPVQDLGTKTRRGSELYDGYLMSYSHFPEVSALSLAEHLNERIRKDNARLKYDDILPQVRRMGEYRTGGVTNVDFLMFDGDFFVPIIRLDLLEKHNLTLPNTWEEVVEYAKFFNGTDLNDDGDPNDYGICHFPRLGAGSWDWWFSEAVYATWATMDQTHGIQQGFFFDEETMAPRFGAGFREAARMWKELWAHGSNAESNHFITGRCAIGFAPPGSWKKVFLNKDGVSRKDKNGTLLWRPTMKSGEYAEPYRFKPFGSTRVVDRTTGQLKPCTLRSCPKAEVIPARGHHGDNDRAGVLSATPLQGQLINRAPFYWSGGLGTLIRKSSPTIKKDLLWDFFVYVNSPDTSVNDVASYSSWIDSWRLSQLVPGDNFINAGWSEDAYQEHTAIMQWALLNDVNGALNLRLPGMAKYTRDVVGEGMLKYIRGSITLDDLDEEVTDGWNEITKQQGKLDQLEVYRAALGLDSHSEVKLCRLHRESMDERDPSTCRQYDEVASSNVLLSSLLVGAAIIVAIATVVFVRLDQKRKSADSVWKIKSDELTFRKPPEVLGQGTFGLVLLAEYRGTAVAVKRVLPRNPNRSITCILGKGDLEDQIVPVGKSILKEGEAGAFVCTNSTCRNGSIIIPSKKDASRQDSMSNTRTLSNEYYGSRTVKHGKLKADFILEMRHLSKLRHPSITTVMGAVISKNEEPMLVMEYMEHGSMYDIVHNESMPLDGDLILSILRDVAQGLRFLHATTPAVIHGDLKSHNILVDSRFRAKVADFGLSAKRSVGATGTPLWMAPELIRGESLNTTASDVYSFGICLWELFSRKDPYEGEDFQLVLEGVADPQINKRPPVPPTCPSDFASIMADCVGGDAELRPTFYEVDVRLKRLHCEIPPSLRRNATRNENLLHKVFPKHIAEALRDGRKIEPDRKEVVTVYFSDIVGFTKIAAKSTPEEVSDMLDRLYLKFDALTHEHDVFKMETIGDAYMCVTNLVKEQDEDHVKRMAEFAGDAIKAARETLVKTDEPSMGYIEIRAGFHCGPAIARVVGSRNPKYSLFGDTVNTASRMESHSLAGRTQCSERAARLLSQQCPDTPIHSRGLIAVKGKGEMHTFFIGAFEDVTFPSAEGVLSHGNVLTSPVLPRDAVQRSE